ncbi:MAG: pseudoazurin [Albidovulum sp.]
MTSPAEAETFEIQMLNKGEAGAMVFEPAFVAAQVGDTVTFLSIDKGHNAESIEGMLPAGVEAFASKLNEEFSMTLTEEGVYGVKCKPHYMMGMVAVIQAGSPVNLEEAKAVKHKGKAKSHFVELLAQVE